MSDTPENPPAFPGKHVQGFSIPLGKYSKLDFAEIERIVTESMGITLLTYAAIHLKQPISEREDINAAILQAKRDDFAAAALQGLLGNAQIAKDAVKLKVMPEDNWFWHADTAYKFADSMLKARQS